MPTQGKQLDRGAENVKYAVVSMWECLFAFMSRRRVSKDGTAFPKLRLDGGG